MFGDCAGEAQSPEIREQGPWSLAEERTITPAASPSEKVLIEDLSL